MEQDARRVGERHLSEGERNALRSNPDSTIVFLQNNIETTIVYTILQCPFEHGGMGGIVGLKYEALKDFIRWNASDDFDIDTVYKNYVPTLLNLGSHYANALQSSQS